MDVYSHMNQINFGQLRGNESIKERLQRMVDKRAIANSLLFAGPDGIGKSLFAYALAGMAIMQDDPSESHRHKILSGNHPDIHIYRPEGKIGMHSIDSLRGLCEQVYLAPYESKWKAFIIHEANRMLSYSANALLKTFEEPAPNTLIILLSSSPQLLLPTVLSRCRAIHFHRLTDEEIIELLQQRYSFEPMVLKTLAMQANGSIGRAIQLAEQGDDPTRDFILKVLAQGKFRTYKDLTQAVQTVHDQIDARKKLVEEAARQELFMVPSENLTASQQQGIEKELEGLVSMRSLNEAEALLLVVQSWHRDLQLMSMNGDHALLFNRDQTPALIKALHRGVLPFEEVDKAIREAQLALQRSAPLHLPRKPIPQASSALT